MKYELHPLCTLFPRLEGDDFNKLRNDIQENGLRQPIVIHEGMILDGGNRYRACLEAGIQPSFIEYDGDNIVSFVLSANLHRRHMTSGQQAAIVSSAQDWAKAQPAYRPEKAGNVTGLSTVADRMSQSGASDKTQRMADKVAKADPELAKKVAHGEISLPKALKKISPEKQDVHDNDESDEPEFDEASIMAEIAGDVDPEKVLEDAQKEIDRLEKIIATNDQLAEIKKLKDEIRLLKSRLDGLQVSLHERSNSVKYWKTKYEKLEKQVKAAGLEDF